MRLKEIKKKILHKLGNLLLPKVISVLCYSVKIELVNEKPVKDLLESKRNFIAAFWHGKMLIPWNYFGGKNFAALVSRSKDGEILTRVLESWKYNVVRGSSHIGGKEALELMRKKIEEGYSIAITPDGPTGPPEKMKAGAVVLAKKTGAPLLLAAVCCEKKKVFSSWDKFELPLPFSKVVLQFSEPITVKNNLTFDETNLLIKETEKKLKELQREVETNC